MFGGKWGGSASWSRADEDEADARVCTVARLLDVGICAEVGVSACVGVSVGVIVGVVVIMFCEVGEPRREDVECGVRPAWTAAFAWVEVKRAVRFSGD